MAIDTTFWKINRHTLEELGVTGPMYQEGNQTPDTFSFHDLDAAFDSTPVFAYLDEIVVTANGVTIFRGTIREIPHHLGTAEESLSYEAKGGWVLLDEMPYSQYFNFAADPANPLSGLIPQLQGLVILGQNNGGGKISLHAAVSAVIGSAIEAGCPIALGNLEGLDFMIPWDQVKDLSHADALARLLQFVPDGVVKFDYTVNPPTFNFLRRHTMPAVALNVPLPGTGGTGVYAPFEDVVMKPRYDLQASGVYLIYLSVNRANAAAWQVRTVDAWPAGINPRQPRCITRTIELAGSVANSTLITQPVKAQTINENLAFGVGPLLPGAAHYDDVARFWKRKLPFLKKADVQILGFSNGTRSLQDKSDATSLADDAAFDPACERELVAGSITDWMQIRKSIKAEYQKISVRCRYMASTDTASGKKELKDEIFTAIITATNAQEQTYSMEELNDFTPAEEVPVGLAAAIHQAMAPLHWDGQFTLVDVETPLQVRIGMVVNLVCAARPEWAAIRALVQSVDVDIANGRTRITVGPPKHLGPDDLKDLYRTNRNRQPVTSYMMRTGGTASTSATTAGLTVYAPRNDVTSTPTPPIQGTAPVEPVGVIATPDELVAAVKGYFTSLGISPKGGDYVNLTIGDKGKFRAYVHTSDANLGGAWNVSFTMDAPPDGPTYWCTMHQLGIY